jgi:hypothetical protein
MKQEGRREPEEKRETPRFGKVNSKLEGVSTLAKLQRLQNPRQGNGVDLNSAKHRYDSNFQKKTAEIYGIL